ncbi:class I adenylate-forming enzyme family protein [Agrococcus sp. 1P02AA]|uniref:class I adenylate-forming enzyme family protein n=1 Tax=Agrococcus sp. 1P02AA TaxID=3132259 RepID=UPI0039A64F9C
MTFTRTMLEVAAADPDRLALAGDDVRLTYAELVAEAARIRAGIEALLGARGPGDDGSATGASSATDGIPVIAVSLSRAIDVGRLVAGIASFRAIVAVLDPLWPRSHRLETVRRVEPALVITDEPELEAALADLEHWHGSAVSLERLEAAAAAAHASLGPEIRPRDEPFLLLFTSGTTDLPKGFLRTRGSWDVNVAVSRRALFAAEGVQTIAPGPVSYSLTLYALVEVLATGGSLFLQSRFDARDAVRTIARHGIERFVGVPSMLLALAAAARREGEASLSSLRWVVTGGANQSQRIRDAFTAAAPHARLRSYYGASEIGFIGFSDAGDGTRLTPFDGVEAIVRDDDGAPVPKGEIGTLHIRVASAVEGYLAATSDDRITGADGWSSVGDLAAIVDGTIALAGRAGDIAVSGGHKVSLPQVERALATVPGCEQCCAVALPDAALGSIVAVVVEGPGSDGDERDAEAPAGEARAGEREAEHPATTGVPAKGVMRDALRRLLPEQFVPRRYYRVDELPRTAGGKIRRTAVAELVAAGSAERL